MNDMTAFFGQPISIYTREQAIDDGVLIDVSSVAREAGLKFPVAITREAWGDCVAWSDADTRRKGVPNDESGRLWDVVWMLKCAARRIDGDRLMYQIHRVPREGKGRMPRRTTLKAICGPGDNGEPTITIMLPNED